MKNTPDSELSTPNGHEHPAVRRFLSAVLACTNGDPVLMVESLESNERDLLPHDLLSAVLVEGRVDAAIRSHDRFYRWLNYWQYVEEHGDLAPIPGTFTVQRPQVSLYPVESRKLFDILVWLASVRGAYAKDPPHPHDPNEVVNELYRALFGDRTAQGLLGTATDWQHWVVRPDFLYSSEGELAVESGHLAYFEQLGTNFSWFGIGRDHFLLFLLNAYPPLPRCELLDT